VQNAIDTMNKIIDGINALKNGQDCQFWSIVQDLSGNI
jgi:hypothetical protein